MTVSDLRLFAALPVPEDVRRWLDGVLLPLRRTGADVKWVRPDGVHWTLHFFGGTPEDRLGEITGLLDRAAAGSPPFDWRPGGLGAFPEQGFPRVLWAGLRQGGPEMEALAARLEREVGSAGFPVEERPFKAHLTLGRVRSPRGGPRLKAALTAGAPDGPPARAESLILYRSELKKGGSVYTPLHESKLKP